VASAASMLARPKLSKALQSITRAASGFGGYCL
jgi:gas vesicle protein